MTVRKIRQVTVSRPTMEGAGVKLRRAFGFGDTESTDPFLLLDDFRAERPEDYLAGFPWHPHRGIETITYMLEGAVEHGDSIGNGGVIEAGGVQWMTAGGGIVHQEMPKPGPGGRMGGFQLWANLPAASKMIPPRYQEYEGGQIPTAEPGAGVVAKVVCGRMGEVTGPVDSEVIDPGYFDVRMEAGARLVHPVAAGYTAMAYVHGGQVRFGEEGEPAGDQTLVLLERGRFGDGDLPVVVTAGDGPARLLLMTGKPLREPVAWRGPIVMNTREQLRTAFRQLDEGTFLDGS